MTTRELETLLGLFRPDDVDRDYVGLPVAAKVHGRFQHVLTNRGPRHS
ncbi:hypothetical protein [Streptomyces sannanensis]